MASPPSWVAIAHLADAAADRHPGIHGDGVLELAGLGRYGVQIFFVLSGLVIAHSIANGRYSFGYLGRFASRRFVRLDLPYWSVIALEVGLLWLSGKVMIEYSRELPPAAQLLANAFYLQRYLGYEDILPVFWTLCYEVQFYLVLVVSLVLLTKLRDAGLTAKQTRLVAGVVPALSFCGSLSIFLGLLPMPHPGLFIDRWYQFSLGVVTYLYFRRYCALGPTFWSVALCVAAGLLFGATNYRTTSALFTAATAVAILASCRFPWWRAPLTGPTMKFLGRISYSLYLLHLAVGWRTKVLVRELFGTSYSTAAAYVAFAVGLAVSIFAAGIMYVLGERPAIEFARRIRLPQQPELQRA